MIDALNRHLGEGICVRVNYINMIPCIGTALHKPDVLRQHTNVTIHLWANSFKFNIQCKLELELDINLQIRLHW